MTRTRRWFLISIPVLIAFAFYSVPFDGIQIVSIDAPLTSTFETLAERVLKMHPFIVHIEQLATINSSCSIYRITNRIPLISSLKIYLPSTYDVEMNIDRSTYCLTSRIRTQFNAMQAYHQYCMHTTTLAKGTTIITDIFRGKAWSSVVKLVRQKMLESHKYTLERLRKEMITSAFRSR